MTISDANPVQFWANTKETFNEKEVDGIFQRCFCKPVNASDPITVQFTDTTGQTRRLVGLSSIGEVIFNMAFSEVSTGVYQATFIPSVYSLTNEEIQLIITSGSDVILRPDLSWTAINGTWQKSATYVQTSNPNDSGSGNLPGGGSIADELSTTTHTAGDFNFSGSASMSLNFPSDSGSGNIPGGGSVSANITSFGSRSTGNYSFSGSASMSLVSGSFSNAVIKIEAYNGASLVTSLEYYQPGGPGNITFNFNPLTVYNITGTWNKLVITYLDQDPPAGVFPNYNYTWNVTIMPAANVFNDASIQIDAYNGASLVSNLVSYQPGGTGDITYTFDDSDIFSIPGAFNKVIVTFDSGVGVFPDYDWGFNITMQARDKTIGQVISIPLDSETNAFDIQVTITGVWAGDIEVNLIPDQSSSGLPATSASFNETFTSNVTNENHTVPVMEMDLRAATRLKAQVLLNGLISGMPTIRITLPVGDDLSFDTILKSDCLDIKEDHDETVLIEYSSNRNFAGLNYSNVTPDPSFFLRVPAVFFRQRFPQEKEVIELSNSRSIQLSAQVKAQKHLQVKNMPDYMHRKLLLALSHQFVTIDDQDWVLSEEYELIPPSNPRWPMQKAQCWLTEKDYIMRSIL